MEKDKVKKAWKTIIQSVHDCGFNPQSNEEDKEIQEVIDIISKYINQEESSTESETIDCLMQCYDSLSTKKKLEVLNSLINQTLNGEEFDNFLISKIDKNIGMLS